MSNPTPKPPVSDETLQAARASVRQLLESAPAYAELPEDKRRQLARDLVNVSAFLAEPGMRVPAQHMSPEVRALAGSNAAQPTDLTKGQPEFGTAVRAGVEQAVALIEGVNFPGFVSGLIEGVFHSIVKSSIEQMEAYGKLEADVSKSLNQFRDDNTTANQGRDHLVEQFPDLFTLQMPEQDPFGGFGGEGGAPPEPRVALREGVDERQAVARVNASLPLDKPITKLDDELVEALLVPAARTQIATGRQQLLATMVMMGINRIVVTDGKIQDDTPGWLRQNNRREDDYGRKTHRCVVHTLGFYAPDGQDVLTLIAQGIVFLAVWSPRRDRGLLARHMAFCAESAARVPVRRLSYPRQMETLPTVRDALSADMGGLRVGCGAEL